MAAKFCIQMYTKDFRNVGYILHWNILYTFCVNQFWSTKRVHHKHYIQFIYIIYNLNFIVYNLYIKFMQNVYTNNYTQNGSLISIYFDPFVVRFLASSSMHTTKTWNVLAKQGGKYQINGLMDYILH